MSEMNELTRSLVRVEELIKNGENAGALNCLWISQNHALSAVKLIKDQSSAMTEQALKIKELTERIAYWQKRAETHEAEIKELDEQEPLGYMVRGNFFYSKDLAERSADHITQYMENCSAEEVYARAAPAKSVPDGYVPAPIDPSPKMLIAARDWSITKNGAGVGNDQATGCYKAMITAAKGE